MWSNETKIKLLASSQTIVFRRRELLSMIQRTPCTSSSMEVEKLCFQLFFAIGIGQLHCIKGQMDRAMYCKTLGKILLPSARTL